MPGINLTRAEAFERRACVGTVEYEVQVDLSRAAETGVATFPVAAKIRFSASSDQTFLDFIAPELTGIELNGVQLDPSEVYDGARVQLTGLQGDNTVVITAQAGYVNTGQGLHRAHDVADGATYLYSQFAVADCRRVFPCFDQPDVKAPLTLTVTAPQGWTVLSNQPAQEVVSAEPRDGVGNASVHRFGPTPPLSSYLYEIAAGPYHGVHGSTQLSDGRTIDLGVYCRASLAEHLEGELVLAITRQGLEFYEDAYRFPYPYAKYDQLFVPEFNIGAMEHPGCVTFTDAYVFRGPVPDARRERRAETILHEMAHMWFGDLVTMNWWDDLWLNESFATYMSFLCLSHLDSPYAGEAWTTFAAMEKWWAYKQDQLPSTHPIVANIRDLEDVEVNFDGITYAKGASVLRQLAAYVGEDQFLAGVRTYLRVHQWSNASLHDFLASLEQECGRDLQEWSALWLEQPGVNTLYCLPDAVGWVPFSPETGFGVEPEIGEPGGAPADTPAGRALGGDRGPGWGATDREPGSDTPPAIAGSEGVQGVLDWGSEAADLGAAGPMSPADNPEPPQAPRPADPTRGAGPILPRYTPGEGADLSPALDTALPLRVLLGQGYPQDHPVLRPHRMRLAGYQVASSGPVECEYSSVVNVEGEVTELRLPWGRTEPLAGSTQGQGAATVGAGVGKLILPNDEDWTYAKLRLTAQQWRLAADALGRFADPLTGALVWGIAWDMVRDAELPVAEFADLALRVLPVTGSGTQVQQMVAQLTWAVTVAAAPGRRAELRDRAVAGLRDIAENSAGDTRLQAVKAVAALAADAESLTWLGGLAEGALPGLTVDTDLAWELLTAQVAGGVAGEAEIAAALESDPTTSGELAAATARAAAPTPQAKAAAWASVVDSPDLPNSTQRAIMAGFQRAADPALLAPYASRYFDALLGLWTGRTNKVAQRCVEGLFPLGVAGLPVPDGAATATLVQLGERWLGTHGEDFPALTRLVRENVAEARRAERAQLA